jgi:protoporphyrinogen oxidase
VHVGRIQNFGAWSPHMVKDDRTCLGLEYFVNEGDELWSSTDEDLVAMATDELQRIGLISDASVVEAGYAVRIPKAYPTYDGTYKDNVDVIRDWLAREVPNVYPVGRNGMHRYNNQDHSMLTAMLTAENILTGSTHDVWSVNVEEDYHEQRGPGQHGTGRAAPVIRTT